MTQAICCRTDEFKTLGLKLDVCEEIICSNLDTCIKQDESVIICGILEIFPWSMKLEFSIHWEKIKQREKKRQFFKNL